jgi:elongation factor G
MDLPALRFNGRPPPSNPTVAIGSTMAATTESCYRYRCNASEYSQTCSLLGLLTMYRLEEAHEPEELAQETIIENLDPKEAVRLSKVRNIGIAVSVTGSIDHYCAIR